jgi:hypothetical protein
MPKPMHEEEDVTVLWNQTVNTDREVQQKGQIKSLKTKKRRHAH